MQHEPMPIEPATQISITLQASHWNTVLEVLQSAPYRVAAPLISEITRQANQRANHLTATDNEPISSLGRS